MSLTQYVVYFLRVPGGILVTDGPLPYSNSISVQYIHIRIRMKYLWLKLAEISEASTSSCCLVGLPLPPLWLSCHSHEAQCSCHLLVAIPMVICHSKSSPEAGVDEQSLPMKCLACTSQKLISTHIQKHDTHITRRTAKCQDPKRLMHHGHVLLYLEIQQPQVHTRSFQAVEIIGFDANKKRDLLKKKQRGDIEETQKERVDVQLELGPRGPDRTRTHVHLPYAGFSDWFVLHAQETVHCLSVRSFFYFTAGNHP